MYFGGHIGFLAAILNLRQNLTWPRSVFQIVWSEVHEYTEKALTGKRAVFTWHNQVRRRPLPINRTEFINFLSERDLINNDSSFCQLILSAIDLQCHVFFLLKSCSWNKPTTRAMHLNINDSTVNHFT